MARFITSRAAVSELEAIIKSAKRELVLLSPFVKLPNDIRDWLREADARGVAITLVYGKRELDEAQTRTFTSFRRLKLYFAERLHAKCFYNESRMIITSLNLLESSEKNDEFGVVLENGEPAYLDADAEARRIITGAVPRNLWGAKISAVVKSLVRPGPMGFCIRCASEIPLDPERPYCGDCFAVWSRFENWDFSEKVCHRCGHTESATRAKPQCYKCFKTSSARS